LSRTRRPIGLDEQRAEQAVLLAEVREEVIVEEDRPELLVRPPP
jgi:hypothetical protein